MTEYRFRHSRGYNFYVVRGNSTKAIPIRALIDELNAEFGIYQDSIFGGRTPEREVEFMTSFVIETIKANATEETTMFDNFWQIGSKDILFARKEPKPVLWRCLNPRCRGYEWKSSPRHTMGCPKCRKEKIERVVEKKISPPLPDANSTPSVLQMRLDLEQPVSDEVVSKEAS